MKTTGLPLTGPGLLSFEAKGIASNPKVAKGFFVPKKFSKIS